MRTILLVAGLLCFAVCSSAQKAASDKEWKLVWSDEFDYTGLPDSTRWTYDVGAHGWGNNEKQYYREKSLENSFVSDGKLHIVALKKDFENLSYTSARLTNYTKSSMQYGKIEVMAKLPEGKGNWPAIWMLPESSKKKEEAWPLCGEIDIMEYWGHDPNTIASNVHTGDYNHTKGTGRGGTTTFTDPWKDYHIYAVEWHADRMDFYFDDKLYYSCKSKGEGIGEWPFNAPQYIIVNFALWNNWNGQPGIDDSIFPQEFSVDYIRVYELK